MDVPPVVDPVAADDPDLPRVLVVGDSINMNYHDAAKAALAGVANYHRNEGHSASTENGVANLEAWLGDYWEEGRHWDVMPKTSRNRSGGPSPTPSSASSMVIVLSPSLTPRETPGS
jgi:hypothetical protein